MWAKAKTGKVLPVHLSMTDSWSVTWLRKNISILSVKCTDSKKKKWMNAWSPSNVLWTGKYWDKRSLSVTSRRAISKRSVSCRPCYIIRNWSFWTNRLIFWTQVHNPSLNICWKSIMRNIMPRSLFRAITWTIRWMSVLVLPCLSMESLSVTL